MRVSEYTEKQKSIDFLITADESCMHNYKLSFMASLIACFPKDILPKFVARYIENKFFSSVSHNNGNAEIALLSLRKIEAFLSDLGFEVVVCPPSEVESFNPKAYLVSTIDPFGIGPASNTTTGISRRSEPFNKFFFLRLINKIRKKNQKAKIVVGGPGAWQFKLVKGKQERLGIDTVFNGPIEGSSAEFWSSIRDGKRVPQSVKGTMGSGPSIIRGPSFWGMVEISRGCGRRCQFCDFKLRSRIEWLPKEFILKEVEINSKSSYVDSITLLSEDTIRYRTPKGQWKPNGKIIGLIKDLSKFGKRLAFTHCCLSTALANPKVTEDFSYYAGLSENNLKSFQTGIESGSPRIISRYMKGKSLPWKPEDWPEIVEQGMAIMIDNYIIPQATLIVGLPEEMPDDTIKTIELVDRLRDFPSVILPLFYVPLTTAKCKSFMADMLTPEQKELLIVAAKHSLKWSGRLPNWTGNQEFFNKFTFQLGAEYSFRCVNSLLNKRFSKSHILSLLTKSFFSALPNLVKQSPRLEYFKHKKRIYPAVEKLRVYEKEQKAPVAPSIVID